jgi:2-oxo-4-hydroxy-4-carboxy-5-ureidoimidazoline decarboxylase
MPASVQSLEALSALPVSSFVVGLGEVFEHAPLVAAAARRPCSTVVCLHDGMMQAVRQTAANRQLAFIAGHPELGTRAKRPTSPIVLGPFERRGVRALQPA